MDPDKDAIVNELARWCERGPQERARLRKLFRECPTLGHWCVDAGLDLDFHEVRWSEAEDATLVDCRAQNLSYNHISQVLGRSREACKCRMRLINARRESR